MNWIKIVMVIFIFLEAGNIFVLYFSPNSKLANGMGHFTAWGKLKEDPELRDLVKYLVNWVAGTKLILLGLLIGLLFTGDEPLLLIAAGVMTLTISAFFWRMFPLIRKMDREGGIEPVGYSQILGWMILGFNLLFLAGILGTLLT